MFAVYWPVRGLGFFFFDDPEYIVDNPIVRGGLTLDGVRWALTALGPNYWMPVNRLALLAGVELMGVSAPGFHLFNLTLHALNVVLVFLVLRRATRETWPSAAAALLFGLHPQRVESVAWIVEIKDTLSLFFALLAVGLHLHAVDPKRTVAGRRASIAAGVACFSLSLMAKPALTMLPLGLLLLDYWPLRRWRPRLDASVGDGGSAEAPALRPLLLEKLPWLAASLVFGVVTIVSGRVSGDISDLERLPLAVRLATAPIAYAGYLLRLVRFDLLAVFYPHPRAWPLEQVIVSVCVLAIISGACLRLGRAAPWLATGWFWFLLLLLPTSGVVQIGTVSMADRFTYAPAIGLAVAVAWSVAALARLGRGGAAAAAVSLALLITACAVGTRTYLSLWADDIRLLEHTIAVTHNNDTAHNSLGGLLYHRNLTAQARPHFEAAATLNPDNPAALSNLGLVEAEAGRFTSAAALLRRSLSLRPDHVPTLVNFGNACAELGHLEESRAAHARAVELAPDNALARVALGITLLNMNRRDEAVEHLRAATKLSPRDERARQILESVLSESPRR